nr:MAG TPA: hypothetical protein [Caudoviricetes sp.]
MKEPDRYNRSTNSAADILDRPDVRDRSPNPPINCLTGCLAALCCRGWWRLSAQRLATS